MAVRYVSEFSFPSDFGFTKSTIDSNSAKGMGAFAKSKAGPSVVPGHYSGKGGGKLTTGAVSKFAKGGHASTPQRYAKGGASTPQRYNEGGWSEHKGVNKNSGMGHKEGLHPADKAKGSGDLKRERLSDIRSPHASRHEIGPRDAKGAPKVDKRTSFNKGPDGYKEGGQTHPHGCECSMCGGGTARYKEGGSIKTAAGKVKMGEKSSWNKDDAVSPGSFKRTPPGEKMTNKQAANSKFDAEGRNTEPATEQNGNVERMSGWSDFKKGGKVHKKAKGGHMKASTPQRYNEGGGDIEVHADRYEIRDTNEHGGTKEPAGTTTSHGMKKGGRISNLKHYAHPPKAAKGGAAGSTQKLGGDAEYERAAGTPKRDHMGTTTERPAGHTIESGKLIGGGTNESPGYESTGAPRDGAAATRGERLSGEPHMAAGGFTHSPSPRANAAIHAKSHAAKDHAAMGALSQVAAALNSGIHQPPGPGMGAPPPGVAPGMGTPPGAPMGPRPMPPMAGGAPGMGTPPGIPHMADGGGVQHLVVHHVHH